MRIKAMGAIVLLVGALARTAWAADMAHEHGDQTFHKFVAEVDMGQDRDDVHASWDVDGWVGGDVNKLHIKTEGEISDAVTQSAEFWALYSRNVSEFWDVQTGVRQDTQPESTSYLVAGVEGLAPYFFETEAHLFLSDEGDLSVRIHQENDLLITQQLVLQPYAEVNLFAQDVPDQDIGKGLSSGEIGVQLRYEIIRKFAPYVDVKYERAFGETAFIARRHGEARDDMIMAAGVRLMF